MLGVVRHAAACPKFSKITSCQYFRKGLNYCIYFLHLVRHLRSYNIIHNIIFVGIIQACWKVLWLVNQQYGFWKKMSISVCLWLWFASVILHIPYIWEKFGSQVLKKSSSRVRWKCSQEISLQDFLIFIISKNIWCIIFIFCM